MRDLIKDQLKQVNYANLNYFDEATQTFVIPKYSKPKYELNKMYLVMLPGSIVNNKESVLASNWNNGNAPISQYLKIYISKTMGKMIYVESVAYDPEQEKETAQTWSGWLPTDEITQIATL